MRKLAAAATVLMLALTINLAVSPSARAQETKELRIAIQPGILFFPMLVMQQAKIMEQMVAPRRPGRSQDHLELAVERRRQRRCPARRQRRHRRRRHLQSAHHLGAVERRGEGDLGRDRRAQCAADARSQRQVAQGLHREEPYRRADAEGVAAGDLSADGARQGVRRLQEARLHHGADGPSAGHHRTPRSRQFRRQPLLRPALHADGAEEPQHPPGAALVRHHRGADQPAGLRHRPSSTRPIRR